MDLTTKEKSFLIKNQDILVKIFQKRIDNLKDQIFGMEKGDKRDFIIEFIKEYEGWIHDLNNLIEDKPEIDSGV